MMVFGYTIDYHMHLSEFRNLRWAQYRKPRTNVITFQSTTSTVTIRELDIRVFPYFASNTTNWSCINVSRRVREIYIILASTSWSGALHRPFRA
ncbi:hypothetical protein M407DRAFT_119580 [Tulasnella calospora MUT 4182]|uniref:Uncharacterized protein n=1 Tax=Tulasnella calospora MUT 4182 TaxID=1051891 RepID=A0A0C3QB61_9AGAM|nr:hypothetical protein M407DRAFT_119580 [Tulasnella calospora MUT 4182]